MKWALEKPRAWCAAFAVSGLFLAAPGYAQNVAQKNPREGDRQAILDGMALYRTRCSGCHAVDGTGATGPNLANLIASGAGDARLFQTIRRGIPNTEMPASNQPDDEIWRIITYLRTFGAAGAEAARAQPPRGNTTNGARMFNGSLGCASCHYAAGQGGRLGPDLSRIGARRTAASLARKIRGTDKTIAPGFDPVTVVIRGGEQIQGVKKGEDAFSIQMMDTSQRMRSFQKSELREVVYNRPSLMPVFDEARLNDSDLDDLVRYMTTLRGQRTATN